MKSATGFLVGRALSLHHITRVRFTHDRRQPRVVCEAGMTGLGDRLASIPEPVRRRRNRP